MWSRQSRSADPASRPAFLHASPSPVFRKRRTHPWTSSPAGTTRAVPPSPLLAYLRAGEAGDDQRRTTRDRGRGQRRSAGPVRPGRRRPCFRTPRPPDARGRAVRRTTPRRSQRTTPRPSRPSAEPTSSHVLGAGMSTSTDTTDTTNRTAHLLALMKKGDDAFNSRDVAAMEAVHHPDMIAYITGERAAGLRPRRAHRGDGAVLCCLPGRPRGQRSVSDPVRQRRLDHGRHPGHGNLHRGDGPARRHRGPPTGKAFDVEFGQTVKWDGDRVIEIAAFWDAAKQAQQIGLAWFPGCQGERRYAQSLGLSRLRPGRLNLQEHRKSRESP